MASPNLSASFGGFPRMEVALAAVFIFVAFVGFSYIKRNEESSIWVGMAKETAHQLGTPFPASWGGSSA